MKESEKLRIAFEWIIRNKENIELVFGETAYSDKLDELIMRRYKEMNRELDVGDGATINYHTDRHACTVIHRTKKKIVVQRDKATLREDFKPDFDIGSFGANCLNNNEQKWEYKTDPNGEKYIGYWSEKKGCFIVDKCLTVSVGRHEFYDYNF